MKSDDDFFLSPFDRPVKTRSCDCMGCSQAGLFRAPKSRTNLNDYYWFCMDHVRVYNASWDFFKGMSEEEVEDYVRNATVWERPSWPLGDWQKREADLRATLDRDFFGGEDVFTQQAPSSAVSFQEREALTVLELSPPVTFATIKMQYRSLVKQHHPDANAGSPESEEKFKTINQAYAILRMIYSSDENDSEDNRKDNDKNNKF